MHAFVVLVHRGNFIFQPCSVGQTHVEASATKVFEESVMKCASMTSWNPTVTEYRVCTICLRCESSTAAACEFGQQLHVNSDSSCM